MPDQTVDLYRLTGKVISNDPVTANISVISYGGSSLVFSYAAVGILLNISYANRRPVLVTGRG